MSSENKAQTTVKYRGRFAPSPTGPMHFGSLLCAVASYLDAKSHRGEWLVRIEDIDPPREHPGADTQILYTLKAHGLDWDHEVLYQSSRSQAYHQALNTIKQQGASYPCTCSRKRLSEIDNHYDGHCRNKPLDNSAPSAIRINTDKVKTLHGSSLIALQDTFQGRIEEDFSTSGDFVIHRKDGLFAYQLAVVIDDIHQGITHIIRGIDLLETSPKQALLFHVFDSLVPNYGHIPMAIDRHGRKLSKQNHAPAINDQFALENLQNACRALGLYAPKEITQVHALLAWAVAHWPQNTISDQKTICADQFEKGRQH